jgi:hypothetical protein
MVDMIPVGLYNVASMLIVRTRRERDNDYGRETLLCWIWNGLLV